MNGRADMKRVALYARVSTTDQRPEVQLDALREYASARGLEVVQEYIDHGVSGTKDRRPALDALLADAKRRRFDGVAAVKLDRLARSVRHLTTMCADWEALGIDLIVVDQGIDTSTASGRFLFHTLAAVAELEGALIRERTKAGLGAARRRGVKLGGRKPVLDKRGRERVQRLRRSGKSIRQIAELVGISVGTVHRAVTPVG
jgi:DNA invertase Pin-like site-specific DNA recombinase